MSMFESIPPNTEAGLLCDEKPALNPSPTFCRSFQRTTSKEYDGPRENIGKAGPFISAKPYRGHVTPGACLCQAGTEVLAYALKALDTKP